MANILKLEKQIGIIKCLVDGNSVRATERIVGCHRDTILRFMKRVGDGCEIILDDQLRDLDSKRIQVDEIWGFVKKKQRHLTVNDDEAQMGDMWTFVALDADSKLVPCYRIGKRDKPTADAFMQDLASRLKNRVQISSDALKAYTAATELAFGGDVDYGQIVKTYEVEPAGFGRYSPPKVTAISKREIVGKPDPDHISTSYVERQNLTMRMCIRRLTRLTNGFSKKLDNLKAAVALHFAYYNFVRIHRTLRVTPAMAAGVTQRLWSVEDLVATATLKR